MTAGGGARASGRLTLAVETSSGIGSVALARDRVVLARRFLPRRGEHAAHLIPSIHQVLEEAGLGRGDIQGIVVGRGPGSFTGVRIAAATANGLALGLQVPIWPWSSLAAAAASHGIDLPDSLLSRKDGSDPADLPQEAEGWPRYVLLDARGERVYAACYRVLADGVETLRAPRAATLTEVLAEELPANMVFCGDGAVRHAARLREAGRPILPLPAGMPTAEGLLRIHHRHPDAVPVSSGSGWEPEYLRPSSAERAHGPGSWKKQEVPG